MFDSAMMGRQSLQRQRRDVSRRGVSEHGVRYDATNVSSPPTDAELDAIFGTPAQVGAGFTAILDDAGAHTAEWWVWSDGASWWYAAGTKAT